MGAPVCLTARSKDELEETAATISRGGGEALVIPCDITEEDAIEEVVGRAAEELGGIAVLVNNAGGAHRVAELDALDRRDFARGTELNYGAVYRTMHAAAPHLFAAALNAVLVDIVSIAAERGMAGMSGPTAAPRPACRPLEDSGPRVGTARGPRRRLGPGWDRDRTEPAAAQSREFTAATLGQAPLGRWGTAEEVADVAAFLVSGRPCDVTGTTADVDGGLLGMNASRWHGREDVRLKDVPDAAVDGFADCLIEVLDVRDLAAATSPSTGWGPMMSARPHPLSGREPPITLGHELVGVLVEGGSVDGSIQPGDRVAVDACLRCEKCAACLRGDYHLCRYGGSVGLPLRRAACTAARRPGLHPGRRPDEVSDSQAASSTEPFAVALHAVERGELGGGDYVLVLGFGPIGPPPRWSRGTARRHPVRRRAGRAPPPASGAARVGDDGRRRGPAERARRALGGRRAPPSSSISTGVAAVARPREAPLAGSHRHDRAAEPP